MLCPLTTIIRSPHSQINLLGDPWGKNNLLAPVNFLFLNIWGELNDRYQTELSTRYICFPSSMIDLNKHQHKTGKKQKQTKVLKLDFNTGTFFKTKMRLFAWADSDKKINIARERHQSSHLTLWQKVNKHISQKMSNCSVKALVMNWFSGLAVRVAKQISTK